MSEYASTKVLKLTPELDALWSEAKAAYEGQYGTTLTFQRHAAAWVERGCKEILRASKREGK